MKHKFLIPGSHRSPFWLQWPVWKCTQIPARNPSLCSYFPFIGCGQNFSTFSSLDIAFHLLDFFSNATNIQNHSHANKEKRGVPQFLATPSSSHIRSIFWQRMRSWNTVVTHFKIQFDFSETLNHLVQTTYASLAKLYLSNDLDNYKYFIVSFNVLPWNLLTIPIQF